MRIGKPQPTRRPILISELLGLFEKSKPPQKILDCNFGRGGHSLALLKKFPQAEITATDCDDRAVAFGRELKEVKTGRIHLLRQNFRHFAESAENTDSKGPYNMILMDLGPSQAQLKEAEQGFGFYRDGPLDMRMDRRKKQTAADILNSYSKKQLVRLFQSFGEIKRPHKTVDKILRQRQKSPFQSAGQLARLLQNQGLKRKQQTKHPATVWFLALRIAVNRELEDLEMALPELLPLLAPEGKWAVISFHSLEDRIVKRAFKSFALAGRGRLLQKKPLIPGREEKKQNPYCRSAKMRLFIKSPKPVGLEKSKSGGGNNSPARKAQAAQS